MYENEHVRIGKLFLGRNPGRYEWDAEAGRYRRVRGANPKAPQYTGEVELDLDGCDGAPIKLRISAWVRESKKDKRQFMSGEVEYSKDEMRELAIKGLPEEAPPADEEVRDENYSSNTKLEDLPF